MMARRRFFVDEIRDGVATVTGDHAAHLTRVLRVEKGQRFELSDNRAVWLAEVREARKAMVEFQIIEAVPPGGPLPAVHLYAALFKFDRFEWMMEKVTELGVERVVPVETGRSDHGLFAAAQKRVERWRKIAREASQQSRRDRLPEVHAAIRLRQVSVSGTRLLLDEDPGAPALEVPVSWTPETPLSLFLGPEGGWTADERVTLKASGWVPASLGPTVLRAETAGMAAVAVLAHALAARR